MDVYGTYNFMTDHPPPSKTPDKFESSKGDPLLLKELKKKTISFNPFPPYTHLWFYSV